MQVCELSSFVKEGKTKQSLQTESNILDHLSVPQCEHCGWWGERHGASCAHQLCFPLTCAGVFWPVLSVWGESRIKLAKMNYLWRTFVSKMFGRVEGLQDKGNICNKSGILFKKWSQNKERILPSLWAQHTYFRLIWSGLLYLESVYCRIQGVCTRGWENYSLCLNL